MKDGDRNGDLVEGEMVIRWISVCMCISVWVCICVSNGMYIYVCVEADIYLCK